MIVKELASCYGVNLAGFWFAAAGCGRSLLDRGAGYETSNSDAGEEPDGQDVQDVPKGG